MKASTSVVFTLAYNTWADGASRGLSWSQDRMAQLLSVDPSVERLTVVDPLRSHLSRLRRHREAIDKDFPSTADRRLLHPRRWRRRDSLALEPTARAYRRLDVSLRRQLAPQVPSSSVLITCHPVLAAVADTSSWRDVVYYGWDDWLNFPPFQDNRDLFTWSYAQIAAHDVSVIGVTAAITNRIGAPRSAVVPNGITATDFDFGAAVPGWFRDIAGPVALYAGSIEERIDVEALMQCARDLPDWTIVLVGYVADPVPFAELATLPNVMIRSLEPRPVVLRMMAEATVCLIPHRHTPMSVAMSPLKLYEYLGAGTPVVATDLAPMRGVSERCLLVQPGEPISGRVLEAAAMAPVSAADLRAFRAQHDWSRRYIEWRRAALGY